jgi:hypothetical protein
MSDFTNHLPNIGWTIFKIKAMPSVFQATGTVIFTIIFYLKGENSFDNVNLGIITPFQLALIGIGIEALHLTSLLMMIYWADPQHVQSLSEEKIVDFLIKKGKIDESVNVSCSRKAKDILRELVGKRESSVDLYKEDIREEIMSYSRKLPPPCRVKGIAEFHRTFAEAIRKFSGVNKTTAPQSYTALEQETENRSIGSEDLENCAERSDVVVEPDIELSTVVGTTATGNANSKDDMGPDVISKHV